MVNKNSELELAKNSSLEIARTFFDEILDTWLGKGSLGLFTAAVKTRNQLIAEQLITKLKNSEIELSDELIQSNEFIGYTARTLLAISFSTKKSKMEYLLNIYINGLADDNFYQRSERYSELVDIISSLSDDSIIVLVEIFKDFKENGFNEQNTDNISRVLHRLNMDYDDFISTCYLLSGKGLIKQIPLASNGFIPLPTSWLESVFHLLRDEN